MVLIKMILLSHNDDDDDKQLKNDACNPLSMHMCIQAPFLLERTQFVFTQKVLG
jgi:hypothetical protein